MKTAGVLVVLFVGLTLLSGCAPGSNEMMRTPNADGRIAGFWMGLWNGIIAPITFVISLFNRSVRMYEVHNSGGWYDLGFLIGICIIFGGSAGGGASRRRREN